MQHHPGSWYMPWGVPLQKMMAVPLHHPSVATVGYHHQTPTAAAVPVAAAQNGQQPTHHQTYQQHQLQPTLHPGAAAAMFTPLSLRTFINPTPPSHIGLGQQALTNLRFADGYGSLERSRQPGTYAKLGYGQATEQSAQQTTHHASHTHAHTHTHTAQMQQHSHANQSPLGAAINLNVGCVPLRQNSIGNMSTAAGAMMIPMQKVSFAFVLEKPIFRVEHPPMGDDGRLFVFRFSVRQW